MRCGASRAIVWAIIEPSEVPRMRADVMLSESRTASASFAISLSEYGGLM